MLLADIVVVHFGLAIVTDVAKHLPKDYYYGKFFGNGNCKKNEKFSLKMY